MPISLQTQSLSLNYFYLCGVALRACVGTSIHMIHYFILHYSILAEINFSVILNILSFTPFMTALGFYVAFKEKL